MKKHNINHLAIIMDGNARWARANNLSKAQGHQKGAEVAKALIPIIAKLDIPYTTLYAFSSENWQRPADEVEMLIKLLTFYIQSEADNLNKNGVKLKIIGKLDKLSANLQEEIKQTIDLTKHNNKITLCIAFSYGSRTEIVDACQKIINSDVKEITEEHFKQYLYDPEMPDVDLLIRPSGEHRISNFLLWQAAYAELYFSNKFWPEFDEAELNKAIENYSTRTRRFGQR